MEYVDLNKADEEQKAVLIANLDKLLEAIIEICEKENQLFEEGFEKL